MTQRDLDRQVALATGENLCDIRQRGFSLADPELVDYDPEPSDVEDMIVDWDQLDRDRNAAFPYPPQHVSQQVLCHA